MNFRPLVFIVSGPSGSGKSTLVQKLLQLPGTMLSVSATTRSARKTESDGKWYNFVSQAEFQQMIERGEFLEYAQVFGKNWYGTPRRWLDEAVAQQKDLVLEIDVQGALQVKKKLRTRLPFSFLLLPARMSKNAFATADRILKMRFAAVSSAPGKRCSPTVAMIMQSSMKISTAPEPKFRPLQLLLDVVSLNAKTGFAKF